MLELDCTVVQRRSRLGVTLEFNYSYNNRSLITIKNEQF